MKTRRSHGLNQTRTLCALMVMIVMAASADPRVDSWFKGNSAKYARVYETDTDLSTSNSKTTWSRNSLSQTLPAYCGVQEIYSSSEWVYIRTTGLGGHIMGPWYLGANRTQLFPNVPVNKRALYRIPKNPTVPTTKTLTSLGVIGYFVDGVAMFDGRDGFYWNGSADVGGGTGNWNRDAYVNEGLTFDPANAHQENQGTYHYHANPIALRFLLNDHVGFNPATKRYFENATNVHHSPIIGWVRDGFPIYGPYGFSNPTNAASGVRRMISGFVPRNGQNGTTNLAATGRTTLPAWAARRYNRSTILSSNEYGPNVTTQYPLGRYLEDNDYLGDLGYVQGTHFDLDEFNMRFCVTPEFPAGTYAYFVCVSANGAPAFPYNIGRAFYGTPSGGPAGTLTEQVTTNFVGGSDSAVALDAPVRNEANGSTTLVWSSVEGGTYRVESSNDLVSWSAAASNVVSQGLNTQFSKTSNHDVEVYRVSRTGLSTFDPVK